MKGPQGKTAVWFFSVAPPFTIPSYSTKHATIIHHKPVTNASFRSRFGMSEVSLWNWVCMCERASQTTTASASHLPTQPSVSTEAQMREETLPALFMVASPEGSACAYHQQTFRKYLLTVWRIGAKDLLAL